MLVWPQRQPNENPGSIQTLWHRLVFSLRATHDTHLSLERGTAQLVLMLFVLSFAVVDNCWYRRVLHDLCLKRVEMELWEMYFISFLLFKVECMYDYFHIKERKNMQWVLWVISILRSLARSDGAELEVKLSFPWGMNLCVERRETSSFSWLIF